MDPVGARQWNEAKQLQVRRILQAHDVNPFLTRGDVGKIPNSRHRPDLTFGEDEGTRLLQPDVATIERPSDRRGIKVRVAVRNRFHDDRSAVGDDQRAVLDAGRTRDNAEVHRGPAAAAGAERNRPIQRQRRRQRIPVDALRVPGAHVLHDKPVGCCPESDVSR